LQWKKLPDESDLDLFCARTDGLYKYTTVLGAEKRINSYDYGTFPNATQLDKALREEKASEEGRRVELERQRSDEQERQRIARENALAARKAAEAATDARVAKFQQQNADRGSGGAQYELGMRYLTGKGVETNRMLAFHWLKSACTNGESSASNALLKLNIQPTPP
jgi:TPR repeat protein